MCITTTTPYLLVEVVRTVNDLREGVSLVLIVTPKEEDLITETLG